MRPNINFVRLKFQEYNALFFEGKLPAPPIVLNKSRRTLGMLTYRRERQPNGTLRYRDFAIKISDLIDRDQQVVEDTIIHEMIHYYILWNQLTDTSAHGKLFLAIMNRINRAHNRHITVTHRSTEEEKDADTQRRHHLVCIIRFMDGHYAVMVVPRTRIFEQWDSPKLFTGVDSWQWYATVDPFFNRYPRSLTAKGYKITSAEVATHLAGAVQLENTGKAIRPLRQ